ncbi:uncharacterized protein KQ657_002505 [Scheffersomyces spartinae]|uniref:Guanine nucleotide exchange factor n=1 Tax=Scheffersomyces spartinae TaxID=45513 RepID=A0A9P7V752_9ASCO|nr:uncharacterized protein KQ657_002505 [Scheffersomyces spartinae]KAG7192140.1 hypothetical protein KQ657_002505 [Scheffersomyces spartinae]
MSFNNLAFNVSKSQATTSTTTATLSNGNGGIKAGMSPILQSMLTKSAPTQEAQMDSVEDTRRMSQGEMVNSDLIGIFDRYDLRPDKVLEEDDKDVEKVQHEPKDIGSENEHESEPEKGSSKVGLVSEEKVDQIEEFEKQYQEEPQADGIIEKEQSINEGDGGDDDEVDHEDNGSEVDDYPLDPLVRDFSSTSTVDEAQTLASQDRLSAIEQDHHDHHVPETTQYSNTTIDTPQYQPSHHPFNFQNFLSNLKRKSANPIVRYIRSFLILFTRQGHTFTGAQKIKIVSEFKSFINDKFNVYEPFASMNAADLENSREGLEKLIMNRIYEQCFPPEYEIKMGNDINLIPEMFKEDLSLDNTFSIQLEKFSWVNGIHLDIDLSLLGDNGGSKLKVLDQAGTELNKLNVYRAPRDKIICILNCCKIIFGFLKSVEQETNADEFMPLLIFVIMKARVSYFISNVHYIENFRGTEWLESGETSYYLSSIEGAIRFIQNIDKDTLTINENEYNAHMESWDAEEKQRELIRKEIEALNLAKLNRQHQEHVVQNMPIPQTQQQLPYSTESSLSPSRVLLTSAGMLTKSITSFLSPSPEPLLAQEQRSGESPQDTEQLQATLNSLIEIFPDMDKGVLTDLVRLKKGDLESCVDACLELINDV